MDYIRNGFYNTLDDHSEESAPGYYFVRNKNTNKIELVKMEIGWWVMFNKIYEKDGEIYIQDKNMDELE